MGTSAEEMRDTETINVALFGAESDSLLPHVKGQAKLTVVDTNPDVIICYGGDGTLLTAELRWPGIPKVPILNSHHGHRCIPRPPDEVIAGLASGTLVTNRYTKLACNIHQNGKTGKSLHALNEINVHMNRINSAVRFKLWINEEPYLGGTEILGDGFLICTPFGSTAYFSHLTRGHFSRGIGIAFKSTSEHIDHFVLQEEAKIRVVITRGPANLAFDSSQEYSRLEEGNELTVQKHAEGAIIQTCGPVKRLNEPF